MKFTIVDSWGNYPEDARNQVFLAWDNWNDFSYFTHFAIFYIDSNAVKHDLGGIKIGFKGQQEKQRVFEEGYQFTHIGENYFSVGVSEEYYEVLKTLPQVTRDDILFSLNDIAKDEDLYDLVVDEPVVQISFFRFLSPSTVTGQFRRMANGGAKLTPFSFTFSKAETVDHPSPLRLMFDVIPDSFPPTNVHVLIGRNGVGKTVLINKMINSLAGNNPQETGFFEFHKDPETEEVEKFANLISVSFSAFDEIAPMPDRFNEADVKFSCIGLTVTDEDGNSGTLKTPSEFSNEFLASLKACKTRGMGERWLKAIRNLYSDPNFQHWEFEQLLDAESGDIRQTFASLSSGHKIVLLTITKLIEQLQEKSLVIMDEPEAHLHPPLLSSYIRTISDLLITTNGVAIIATHSPVVVQEVPKSCVWKLRRSNNLMVAERLELESFGENVGILTNEVFGLEVTESGFYQMILQKIKDQGFEYNAVIDSFNNQLGSEARLVTMAAVATKKK